MERVSLYTSLLAERAGKRGRVTGVDPNTASIAVARRNSFDFSNLSFSEGSSDEFPSGPYDLVFSNHVLHYIQDKVTVFNDIHSSLKDSGTFAFVCAAETDARLWHLYKLSTKQKYHFCGKNELEMLAHKCGFQVERIDVEPMKYNF